MHTRPLNKLPAAGRHKQLRALRGVDRFIEVVRVAARPGDLVRRLMQDYEADCEIVRERHGCRDAGR